MQRDHAQTRSAGFQAKTQRSYREPEITLQNDCSYNYWGNLGLVFGINVPFVSQIATDIRDDEDCFLWSSKRLVLILAEAGDAYRNGNTSHNADLLREAINYCNEFLPRDDRLADDAVLRLLWLQNGTASISCEENKRMGGYMDIVKQGPSTAILAMPFDAAKVGLMRSDGRPFTSTGEPRRSRDD